MQDRAKQQAESRSGLSARQIHEQLNRILASETFTRSERMSAFLRYVVEQTLAGNGPILKEPVIAQDCFGRGTDFEGAVDPIVRIEARRLRDKLREYYENGEGEAVIIKLPKGGYVPSFERNAAATPVVVPPVAGPERILLVSPAPFRRRFRWLAGALAAVFIGGVAWLALRPDPAPRLGMRRLSFQTRNESSPSLSPDGNFVVFSWSKDGPADLYIKAVDGEALLRLTETPQNEYSPAWSPDGSQIAFLRGREGPFIIAAIGGAERKVGQTSLRYWAPRVGWSADSKSVLLVDARDGADTNKGCVYRIALDTLEKRQVTFPPPGTGDEAFAASPDGRTLAVVRNSGRAGINDIFLVTLTGGEAQRLTTQKREVDDVVWTPDGKYLIYSVLEGSRFRLWRTAARAGAGNGEPFSPLGEYADMPSVARSAATGLLRVAYRTRIHDVGLRIIRLDPSGPTDPVGTDVPFADATEGRDSSARISPDSNQVAFWSIRTGEPRLWLANIDGSALRTLTPIVAQELKPGGWSPDSRRLVFDATIDGNTDVYITDSAGTQPVRLTSDPSLDLTPAWSPDGDWIYFASDRTGRFEVWKVPCAGGQAAQITFHGGFKPQPSTDGRYIYYVYPTGTQITLKRVPSGGGEESVLVEGVWHHNYWTVSSKGVYLLAREQSGQYLDLYDPASGRRTRLGKMPVPVAPPFFSGFISASQDGRYLVVNHTDREETNLGLLESR